MCEEMVRGVRDIDVRETARDVNPCYILVTFIVYTTYTYNDYVCVSLTYVDTTYNTHIHTHLLVMATGIYS